MTPGPLEGRNAIKESWQQNLARYLGSAPWVITDSIKTIEHTAVPIITLVTRPMAEFCSVSLDISFEDASHNGLRTNDLVKDLADEFPALVPLTVVLKQFL